MTTRLVLALLLVLGSFEAAAAEPATTPPLHVELAIDLPITLGAAALWGITEGLKGRVGSSRCRWCDTPETLNGFDALPRRVFVGADRGAASVASDVLALGAMPALALGLDLALAFDSPRSPGESRARRFGVDFLLMAEAATTAMGVNQLAKFSAGRRRPDALGDPTDGTRDVDENLSYFSGHSTLAFAIATSAGTIASLRRDRLAPLTWVLGLSAASATAILRVAADRHFASDVLTGMVVGGAVGALVPVLHRARAPFRVAAAVHGDGGVVTLSGGF